MRELAEKMGVNASHLSQIATGAKPWTAKMREKAEAVLGEVPGQGILYRQGAWSAERAATSGNAPANWA